MSREQTPTIYLKDYQVPDFLIDETHLSFDIEAAQTRVSSQLLIRRNPASQNMQAPLVLNGKHLKLVEITLDKQTLMPQQYRVDDETLTIAQVPEQFILSVVTEIDPPNNTSLAGLFVSGDIYCTQCEANGFARMTYYIDRPDVMSKFTTVIKADKQKYPLLLSNGNCVAKGDLTDNRHWVEWQDPFKKPAYLFALVAGKLSCIEDTFTTFKQREIALKLYVEAGNEGKAQHAMISLKQAMRWDEEHYGREYDLDLYMIVAVKDFNMGAMENKGLNIFNAKYILADAHTATDLDYQHVQHVVGHEYFHNWSGNRVTLRDWFQLSLKEGFTVFREQQFAAAMGSAALQRIEQAKLVRSVQFAEDAGPMAHPVRPASYIEINNFYTMTVYEKGAEVIRMLHTLLGPKAFRLACDDYFASHDGEAVTTDDFVAAMQRHFEGDLTQFKLWYSQAGTPELTIDWQYDPLEKTLTLNVAQHIPPTPGQADKKTMHIPLKVALLDTDGQCMPLKMRDEPQALATETVLNIQQADHTFVFTDLKENPVPSLLRSFSAPVKLKVDLSEADLLFIAAHDNDPYCRWDSAQALYLRAINQLCKDVQEKNALQLPASLLSLMQALLTDTQTDPALLALMLHLPTESLIADSHDSVDIDAIHAAHSFLEMKLAELLHEPLADCYNRLLSTGPYQHNPVDMAKRSLKNSCLAYLTKVDTRLAQEQFELATNMTDCLAALSALSRHDNAQRAQALQAFYQKWRDDALVLDKWFALQATAHIPDALAQVEQLTAHPAFSIKNPNKVYALLGQFSRHNPYYFHQADGQAYRFIQAKIIQLDTLNPQVAARLVHAFAPWKRYDKHRRALMQQALQQLQQANLSKDVYEIVSKSLAD